MLLFCHNTNSHQGCSVASVGMWGVCLLDVSYSLWIDFMERLWWGSVLVPLVHSFNFFSFFISMQYFSYLKTWSLICSLNHGIDFCASVPLEWPVWLNGWVFVYELSGCRFESSCSHLKLVSTIFYQTFVIFPLPFHTFQIQKNKWKWNNLWCHELACINLQV